MRKQSLQQAIGQIPKAMRRKLNLTDLKVLTGALLIRDRIEAHFDQVYQSEKALRLFKLRHGYCTGRPFCMTHMGDSLNSICNACLRSAQNPKRSNQHSEYGMLQLQKRKAEKE